MSINVEDVRLVAALARLEFDEKEERQLALEFNRIVAYMAKLNELATEQVQPTSHVVPIVNAFRSDEVVEFPDPEVIGAAAPQREESYIRVPRIID